MKRVAEALRISRPHLSAHREIRKTKRGSYKKEDAALLERIHKLVEERPTYGYRRVTALLNRRSKEAPVNHKRVYRVMKGAGLVLPKYGAKPERAHDGKVITLKSDLRWCSDGFEIRCWNGEKVYVAFSLDCCDREAIAWIAATRHLNSGDIRDLIAMSVEARFGGTRAPNPLQWLTDNGGMYIADETRAFAASCNLQPKTTPSYSPESNGMAESFVKTFKHDYVYVADLWDAKAVLESLPKWFADYNEHHPHKGLKMLSPRQFRRAHSN